MTGRRLTDEERVISEARHKNYMRDYRQAHQAELTARAKEERDRRHQAYIREYRKAYYLANKEAIKAKTKAYAEGHKNDPEYRQKMSRASAAWAKANPDKRAAYKGVRRSRMESGPLDLIERAVVWERDVAVTHPACNFRKNRFIVAPGAFKDAS